MRPDTQYKDLTDSHLIKLLEKKYGKDFSIKQFEDGELEDEFCWRIAQAPRYDSQDDTQDRHLLWIVKRMIE